MDTGGWEPAPSRGCFAELPCEERQREGAMLDTRDSIASPAHPPLFPSWNGVFRRRAVESLPGPEFARFQLHHLDGEPVIFAGRRGCKGPAVRWLEWSLPLAGRTGREGNARQWLSNEVM